MKIINDTPSENITFGELNVGDTFLYSYSDGIYDREDVYVRMNSITTMFGGFMNAFRLKYNWCVNFSENTPVKKIDCVINVVGI